MQTQAEPIINCLQLQLQEFLWNWKYIMSIP